jgi:hypothetical protein
MFQEPEDMTLDFQLERTESRDSDTDSLHGYVYWKVEPAPTSSEHGVPQKIREVIYESKDKEHPTDAELHDAKAREQYKIHLQITAGQAEAAGYWVKITGKQTDTAATGKDGGWAKK